MSIFSATYTEIVAQINLTRNYIKNTTEVFSPEQSVYTLPILGFEKSRYF